LPYQPTSDDFRATVEQIRYFLELARTSSQRKAAEALGTTQPNLGNKVRELEKALGMTLVSTTKRGTELTDQGRQLVERAEAFIKEYNRLVLHARNLRGGETGVLSIACYPVHVERFLSRVIGRFRREHPNVELDLTQMRDDRRRAWGRTLFDELVEGEVELAMGPPHISLGLSGIKAYDARLVAMVDDAHTHRHEETIPITELKGENLLIAPEQYFSRERVSAAAEEAGFSIHVSAQSSSPTALLSLGRHGVGIPILPDDYPLVGQHHYPYPTIETITGEQLSTEVWLQWKEGRALSYGATNFIRIAAEEVAAELERGTRVKETYYHADLGN
jgi:LysR family transcriptional regulator, hydrogen peroxide-inducible genes activator